MKARINDFKARDTLPNTRVVHADVAADLLNALKIAEATLDRLAPGGTRATQGTRDVIDAAIAKAEGKP